jgi:hypothetical protein
VLSELDAVRASEHNSARAAWVAPNQSIAGHEGGRPRRWSISRHSLELIVVAPPNLQAGSKQAGSKDGQQVGGQRGRAAEHQMGSVDRQWGWSDTQPNGHAAGQWGRVAGQRRRTAQTQTRDTDIRQAAWTGSRDGQRGQAAGQQGRAAGQRDGQHRHRQQTQTNTVQGVARRRWRPSDNRHRPDTYIDGHGQQAQPTCLCTFSKLDLQTPSPHDDQESAMHDA